MTTYATATHEPAASVSNARIYWKISGLALTAVAGLGILLNTVGMGRFLPSFLEFDWTHNIVHVLLAGIALYMGFSSVDYAVAKAMAKVVGVVYLGLGILGFIPGVVTLLHSMLGLHLEIGENLVHIVLGAWGAYAGFAE